jgi:hypothetical protein
VEGTAEAARTIIETACSRARAVTAVNTSAGAAHRCGSGTHRQVGGVADRQLAARQLLPLQAADRLRREVGRACQRKRASSLSFRLRAVVASGSGEARAQSDGTRPKGDSAMTEAKQRHFIGNKAGRLAPPRRRQRQRASIRLPRLRVDELSCADSLPPVTMTRAP